MKDPLIFQAMEPIIQALEALGIPYQIIGSVASSAYGIARSTLDVDITADMNSSQVHPLFERLQDAYYIDEHRKPWTPMFYEMNDDGCPGFIKGLIGWFSLLPALQCRAKFDSSLTGRKSAL
jgi:hypothetical protein